MWRFICWFVDSSTTNEQELLGTWSLSPINHRPTSEDWYYMMSFLNISTTNVHEFCFLNRILRQNLDIVTLVFHFRFRLENNTKSTNVIASVLFFYELQYDSMELEQLCCMPMKAYKSSNVIKCTRINTTNLTPSRSLPLLSKTTSNTSPPTTLPTSAGSPHTVRPPALTISWLFHKFHN